MGEEVEGKPLIKRSRKGVFFDSPLAISHFACPIGIEGSPSFTFSLADRKLR